MPPRTRRKGTESLREEIVGHAAQLIAERGFGGMSIAEVAEAAGLSKQALMYHFKTKDSLKLAVLERLLAHANRAFLGLMSVLEDAETPLLDQALTTLQGYFDEEPHAARVILRFFLDEDVDAISRIVAGAQPWMRVLGSDLKEGQRAGIIRADLDAEAAIAQIGMLVLTNFAMLPVHGGNADSPRSWRKRRLTELLRTIRTVLFVEAPRRRPSTSSGRTGGSRSG